MAPTSTDQMGRRPGMLASPLAGSFPANHDGRLEPFAKLRRRPHHSSNSSFLWSRQSSLNPEPGAPADSDLATPGYTLTTVIHASIAPQPIATRIVGVSSTTNTYASHKHVRTAEITLIVIGAVFAVLLCLGMIVIQTRKPNFFPVCFRRCRRTPKFKKEILISPFSKKGILVKAVNDYDDLTWGTPTRIIHFESTFDGRQHDREPVEPRLHQHKELLSNPVPLGSAPTRRPTFIPPAIENRPYFCEETFRERLHIEEEDIASTLTVALRDLLASGTSSSQPPDNMTIGEDTRRQAEAISSLLATDRVTAISTFESLRDGLNGVGKHASIFGFKNRPRQGSDASASSQETTTTHFMECFSSTDSRSSMTSIANSDIDVNDEDGHENTYELKRAQTQSLEIKKGVLIAWQCTNLTPTNIGMPSKVVISEPCQMDSNDVGMTYSSGGSAYRLGELGTTQTVSSLVREISLGTLSSLSSTTRAEGWCADGEGFLQPPVPYLMVTRPSTSSIFTTDSNGSSISIDLNDFPHPPSLAQPTYLQLTDQIPSQKRVWDNHPLDSTMAQKRSTVERFIMMYETD